LKKVVNLRQINFLEIIHPINNVKMHKVIRILVILVLFFSVNTLFAQKNKGIKPDKRKTETKEVQVFGEENEDYFKTTKGISAYNIVKINPFATILGDFSIYFERVLNAHLAAEVYGGATLRPRYALALNDLSTQDPYTENIETRLGYLAGFDLKYYPSKHDDAPDGFYMSIGSRYKKYQALSFGFDDIGVPLTGEPTFKTPLIVTDFVRVTAGSGNLNDNFFSDCFVGFSLQNRLYTQAKLAVDPITSLTYTNLETTKRLVPAFFVGVKIGFSF
jgi:hypothetical protein